MNEHAKTNLPRRPNVLLRLLSDVSFGIIMLVLILLYASIGSGVAPLRGALEMTEMQIFQHWLFVLLIVLFGLALLAATLTRVKWTRLNAGALTVHIGLLLLIGGSIWYFGQKVEGDVPLVSPRIELLGSSGEPLAEAALLAEAGQTWAHALPGVAGQVRLTVIATKAQADQPVAEATVAAQFGDAPQQTVTLAANRPPVRLDNGLRLRLRTFPAQTRFYDDSVAALYCRKTGETTDRCVELPGLPLHRERYLPDDGELHDSNGRPVSSKRTYPYLALGGLKIPTGWFEPWCLPGRQSMPDLPFDVEITGYVPYITGMETAVADGREENPVVSFRLSAGEQGMDFTLGAFDPARSVLETRAPIEFRWVKDPAELEALLKPQVGPNELAIEVLDPPARQTLAVQAGQKIPVAGTPYEITIKTLMPSWPLATPGFENAHSPVALVQVASPDKSYQRTVVQRFPQLSQDIDERGVRHAEGPYDPNLKLQYRTCAEGRALILAGPDLPPLLAVFQPDGTVQRRPLESRQVQPLALPSFPVELTLTGLRRNGRLVTQPVIAPLETRRPGMGRGPSAIRVKLTGRGELAGWSESYWCMFNAYPLREPDLPEELAARPVSLRLPDGREYELTYSRAGRSLGTSLVPGKLSTAFFPGRRMATSWRSDFYAAGGQAGLVPEMAKTNQTCTVGPWTFFQSGAASDHWSYTMLGVGNRRGMWPMGLGCLLITLGCLYAFYVKPIIRRRAAAARIAEPDGAGSASAPRGTAVAADLKP